MFLVEKLAETLASRIASAQAAPGDAGSGWRLHVRHRELAREGHEAAYVADRQVPSRDGTSNGLGGEAAGASPVQAQEA